MVEDEERHSEDERQEEESKKAAKDESKLGEEATVAVIQKAKTEDDEYKTDDGEKNYYSIAHTIHEKVHGQASILVNGKLKGIPTDSKKNELETECILNICRIPN